MYTKLSIMGRGYNRHPENWKFEKINLSLDVVFATSNCTERTEYEFPE